MYETMMLNIRFADAAVTASQFDADGVERLVISRLTEARKMAKSLTVVCMSLLELQHLLVTHSRPWRCSPNSRQTFHYIIKAQIQKVSLNQRLSLYLTRHKYYIELRKQRYGKKNITITCSVSVTTMSEQNCFMNYYAHNYFFLFFCVCVCTTTVDYGTYVSLVLGFFIKFPYSVVIKLFLFICLLHVLHLAIEWVGLLMYVGAQHFIWQSRSFIPLSFSNNFLCQHFFISTQVSREHGQQSCPA